MLRIRITQCCFVVIFLIDAGLLHEIKAQHTARNLAVARCRQITRLEIFPIQRIVPQCLGIARCSDMIGNLPRIGDIFRLRHAVVLGKVCPLRTVNGKGDHVAGDNLARIRLKGTSRRDGVFAGAVVGLRRLAAADLERCAVNLLTGDCPLAVNGLIDLVVVLHRAELIVKRSLHLLVPNIVLGAVARVHILGKGSTRTAPVAAEGRITGQLSPILRLQITGSDTVRTKDCIVDGNISLRPRDLCNRSRIIRCTPIISLRGLAHCDIQLARCDCSRIGNGPKCCRNGLIIPRAARCTDDMVAGIHNLIIIRIFPCELCCIVDGLLDDIAAHITRNILVRIGGGRSVHRLTTCIIDQRKVNDAAPALNVSITVGVLCHSVVNLRDFLRHRLNLRRSNTPCCCHMCRVVRINSFEVTLMTGCAERIVRERVVLLIGRLRHDIIGDVMSCRNMGGPVHTCSILGKVCCRIRHERKGHLVLITCNDAGVAQRRCIRREVDLIARGICRCAIVDLLRRGERVVALLVNINPTGINAAAHDLAVAVLFIRKCIVCAKRVGKACILHRAVACIPIFCKISHFGIAIAAGDTRRIEICNAEVISIQTLFIEPVVQIICCDLEIRRRAVINLRNIGKFHRDCARRDNACVCARQGAR